MGTHRLDYPTAAAPTASLVFSRGARLTDDTPRINLNQSITRTWGGTPRAQSFGDANRIYPLTAIFASSSGSETDFADVVTFIMDSIEGGVNSFQWTDEDGTVRTVRLMNEGGMEFPKHGHDSQRCTFLLEVIP